MSTEINLPLALKIPFSPSLLLQVFLSRLLRCLKLLLPLVYVSHGRRPELPSASLSLSFCFGETFRKHSTQERILGWIVADGLLLMDSTEERLRGGDHGCSSYYDTRLTRHFSSGVNSVRANGTLQPKRQQ